MQRLTIIIHATSMQRARNFADAVLPHLTAKEKYGYSIEQVTDNQHQEQQQCIEQAAQLIERLERHAEDYGEHRMVQLSEEDAKTLKNAVELARRSAEIGL